MADSDDLYSEKSREELVDEGEISPEEEAFIAGYEGEEENEEQAEDTEEENEEE